MLIYEIFGSIGVMTISYFISDITGNYAKQFDEEKSHRFWVKLLVIIHFISAALSLFVGLIMHFYLDHKEELYRRSAAEKLGDAQQEYISEICDLKTHNLHLQSRIRSLENQLEEKTYEKGRHSGYICGYAVGFEDCMDVLDLPADQKMDMCRMARMSGVHRIKTRPSVFDGAPAININGILK
ncbi:MAG: hypothetical protein E7468_01410 [Ruminococcaceae bacterium]|nr:hypothetical protein [Oscillospiraceae bacterium]